MSYQIDPRKVAGVIVEANGALQGKGFNHGEVIIGLTELVGRTIVDAGQHHIHHDELKKVVTDHLDRTVRIGAFATGKSNIAQE